MIVSFTDALLTKTSTVSIKIFMDKQIFSNFYYSNSSLTIWCVRRKQKILSLFTGGRYYV